MDAYAGFLIGFLVGALFFGALITSINRVEAVKSGHAEYFINTNSFDKEFRWKQHKDL